MLWEKIVTIDHALCVDSTEIYIFSFSGGYRANCREYWI